MQLAVRVRIKHFEFIHIYPHFDCLVSVIELQTVIAVFVRKFKFTIPEEFEMFKDGCFITTV